MLARSKNVDVAIDFSRINYNICVRIKILQTIN